MPFEIPLFPLSVVLFPGMQLPLHIFEPRYRLMTARALEGDSTFGVALLTEGREGEAQTVPASVGCSAHITDSTRYPDGRMNLMTVGRRRFRILETREQDGYLIGTCEWIDDASPEPSQPSESLLELAAQVRILLGAYLASLARNANLSPGDLDDLDVPSDPESLSMWVASVITISNEHKQELLEMTTTGARLRAEKDFLRRGEVVQRAYARRGTHPKPDDDSPFAQFVSLN